MRWNIGKMLFLLIILSGIITLITSLWDIIYKNGWRQQILAGYMILILLDLVLISIRVEIKSTNELNRPIKEFEKTLQGKLYHFQCPNCHGIFAVKKSSKNNKKAMKLTCPDCGMVGVIPISPKSKKRDSSTKIV